MFLALKLTIFEIFSKYQINKFYKHILILKKKKKMCVCMIFSYRICIDFSSFHKRIVVPHLRTHVHLMASIYFFLQEDFRLRTLAVL